MSGQWKKRGERKPPLSPLLIALAPVLAKAQQLGRIQAACLRGKLSWAAYYAELNALRSLQFEFEQDANAIGHNKKAKHDAINR